MHEIGMNDAVITVGIKNYHTALRKLIVTCLNTFSLNCLLLVRAVCT